MESSQQHALELALKFFYIPDDIHLSLNDRLRFNWLLQQPLGSWQFLVLTEYRPREGGFVSPTLSERLMRKCSSFLFNFFLC
jgi:hypothetical protein